MLVEIQRACVLSRGEAFVKRTKLRVSVLRKLYELGYIDSFTIVDKYIAVSIGTKTKVGIAVSKSSSTECGRVFTASGVRRLSKRSRRGLLLFTTPQGVDSADTLIRRGSGGKLLLWLI